MRRRWPGRLGVVVALIVGCASEPRVPPGITDVNGFWEGTWDGGAIGRGHITIDLTQRGTDVTGKLAMTGVAAISATDGPLTGRINGETFSFEQRGGVMEGDMAVKGDTMSGQTAGRLKVLLVLRRRATP